MDPVSQVIRRALADVTLSPEVVTHGAPGVGDGHHDNSIVVVTWDRALASAASAAASMSLRLSQPRGRHAPEIPSGWAAELPGRDE